MTQKIDTVMLDDVASTSVVVSAGAPDAGKVVILDAFGLVPNAYIGPTSTLTAQSSDPSTPAEGTAVLWLSDGDATGDTGDLMVTISSSPIVATYVDAVDFAGFTINDSFTISVPLGVGGGTGISFLVITEGVDATGSASAGANRIAVGCSSGPSAGTLAETVVDAINGHYGSGGLYNHSFASANTGVFTAAGVTATLSGSTKVTLTSVHKGFAANSIQVANVSGNAATNGFLVGGLDTSAKTATIVDFSAA